MKRAICILALCICLVGLCGAQASPACVEEQWEWVEQTLPCDGYTVEVAAWVGHVEEDVRTWQTDGKDWQQTEVNALAQTLLGAGEVEHWQSWAEQGYTLDNAQGAILRLSPDGFTYRRPSSEDYDLAAYPYWEAGQWYAVEPVNLAEVPSLDGVDIAEAMELVADALEPLGLSLGTPCEVQAWDAAALARSAEAWYGIDDSHAADVAALSPCYRLTLPVYCEGYRLGPGLVTGPQGDISGTEGGMIRALVNEEGIVELLADEALLEAQSPMGEPQPPMSAAAALAQYQKISPQTGYGPGAHRVEKMLLQYLYAWEQSPGVTQYTYTLRPVWCFYTIWEMEIDYAGLPPIDAPAYGLVVLDAVTGELLDPLPI